MTKRRNLYEVLGVPRDADAETIRRRYKKLARENHPDLNPGDEAAAERFKEISHAYAVLSDEEKRRAYDEFGEISLDSGFDADEARKAREAFSQRFGRTSPRSGPDAFASDREFAFGDLDDLLGSFFGGGAGRSSIPLRGADLESSLELDFLDAVRGGEHRLTLTRPTAEGSTRAETVTVRTPAGVTDGGRLRLPGLGGPGRHGGPAGDLWVTVRVRPHPIFRRDGRDLWLELPLTIREAVLGAEIEIPTPTGRATLKVPAGTQGGARLRLRGLGVPAGGGKPAGDLYARVQIRVPRSVDEETRRAIETLPAFDDPAVRKERFRT